MTPPLAASRSAQATDDPVVPGYGSSTLADLLPSVAAHLGVPGYAEDPLRLSPAQRYVVVLVDGLGFHLVRRAVREAPYLGSLLGDALPLTSGVPSTTATSLASLGTGLPPGGHGLVGFTSRVPGSGEILDALAWDGDVAPRAYQPKPTVFERARDAGVAVSSVALARFEHSGLTEAALRGPDFVPVRDEHQDQLWSARIVTAATRGTRSVVYVYERELDHCGHTQGCESDAWRRALARIDARCELLRDALPDDVRLLVTGDHGMVDVPAAGRVIAEDEPDLVAGVSALAGEARFRHLYVDVEPPAAVAARWADRLGALAWVRTREQAVDEGWFGPVDETVRERFGHVLVALRGRAAVMTRQLPRELSLVGMHGSLTADEMSVPLFCD